jgi:hypothetical protein
MRTTNRRGGVAVMIAGGLTCFMLFLGLVVDVGFWYTRKAQAQLNADLAALAAMGAVDQTQGATAQASFITATALGVLAANGYDTTKWSVATPPAESVSGALIVTSCAVSSTQMLPRFFTAVLGSAPVPMKVESSAEKRLLPGLSSSCAIIALNTFNYSGGGNNSIDSFLTTYSAVGSFEGKPFDNQGAHACANGNITMNGNVGMFGGLTSGGNISISGGSYTAVGNFVAKGSISSGPDSGTSMANQNVPVFTFPKPVPPANIATVNDNASITGGCGQPNSSGAWTCNGNKTAILTAGKSYYFTDVKFTGQANIRIDGSPGSSQTVIWMNGPMDLAGGASFKVSDDASGLGNVTAMNLRINGIADNQTISLKGGSEMVADIVAPTMTIDLGGNPHLFGRMIAKNIDVAGTAAFSFDESLPLLTFTAPGATVRVHLIQ